MAGESGGGGGGIARRGLDTGVFWGLLRCRLGRAGLGGGTDSFLQVPVLADLEAVTSEAIEVSGDVIGSPSPDHLMVRPREA